ncbi:MAG: heme-copper oxidase subunit III [Deltaproteobacteria bacterium]|nr:heme-copper oxidase subunit III [Deltaproteobacteria bacterium]
MLFGGLISAYVILRSGSAHMVVPPRSMMGIPLATFNTFALITSSVTMVLALAAIQEGNIARFQRWLLCTIGGGVIFLCVKAYEYQHKWEEGITISSNLFGSFYYTLTGLHVVHVTGGLFLMAYLLWAGTRGEFTPESHDRVECAGLYWHFVDLVWVILFPILYLL